MMRRNIKPKFDTTPSDNQTTIPSTIPTEQTLSDVSMKHIQTNKIVSIKTALQSKDTKKGLLPSLLLKDPISVLVSQIEKVRRSRRLFRLIMMPSNMLYPKEQLEWLQNEFLKTSEDDGMLGFWGFFDVLLCVDPDLEPELCFNAIQSLVCRKDFDIMQRQLFVEKERHQDRLSSREKNLLSKHKVDGFWLKFAEFRNSTLYYLFIYI